MKTRAWASELGSRTTYSHREFSLRTLTHQLLPPAVCSVLSAVRHQPLDHLPQWLYDRVPDRYVQASQYERTFGRPLNLETPQTFNEKLHWLMLYYRVPEMTQLADKYAVRSYVAARCGERLLNELYGVWDDPSALAFEDLPESFVLKVTSGSAQNIFCRDKSQLNVERTRRQLVQWMKRSEYWAAREWSYKDITPRIVCERLLSDNGNVPADYKFFCFDGEPRVVQVDTGCFTSQHRRDFFDDDWKRLPFNYHVCHVRPTSDQSMSPPGNLKTMISVARSLSQGFPFVRVDLYSIAERVIFGEMTWYPGGGLGLFTPDTYDLQLGNLLTLPTPSAPHVLRRFSSST